MGDRQFVCNDDDCPNSKVSFTVDSDFAYCWRCGHKMREWFEPTLELTPEESKELLKFFYAQGGWSSVNWPLIHAMHQRLHNLYE